MLLYHRDANVHEQRLSAHESTVVIRDRYYQYMLVQFNNRSVCTDCLATWNVMNERNEVRKKEDCIDMQRCLKFFPPPTICLFLWKYIFCQFILTKICFFLMTVKKFDCSCNFFYKFLQISQSISLHLFFFFTVVPCSFFSCC